MDGLTPEVLGKVAAILAVIGVVLPHVQALIQRPYWSPRAKALITVLLSLLAGVIAYVVENGFTWRSWPELGLWIAGAWAVAAIMYARLWRPLETTAPLEEKVNSGTPASLREPTQDHDPNGDPGPYTEAGNPEDWADDPNAGAPRRHTDDEGYG